MYVSSLGLNGREALQRFEPLALKVDEKKTAHQDSLTVAVSQGILLPASA